MNKLLIAIVCLFSIIAKGQNKIKTDLNEKIKIDSEKWFKDVYVESLFKDPYSYRLMKITSTPTSREMVIKDSILYLKGEIEKCSLPIEERSQNDRDEYQKEYDSCLKAIEACDSSLKSSSDNADYIKKRRAIHVKYAKIYLDRMKEYDIYQINLSELDRLEQLQSTLTTDELGTTTQYKIKLDCYSKNSLGNEVLGRYEFPFTAKGVLGSGDGKSNVIQINKE